MSVAQRVSAVARRLPVLRTLVVRDLQIRYAGSWLGYLWSVLEPLAMSVIYYFVFVVLLKRSDVGHSPYMLFLVIGLLTWQCFSGALNDVARALLQDARLVRSTSLPREIWVLRVVIAKLVEFIYSLPVLVAFAVIYLIRGEAGLNWRLVLFPVGVLLLALLLLGLGLVLAPVTALVNDLQRIIRIVLRIGFYTTPIIYAAAIVPKPYDVILAVNPLSGIMELLRAGFFDEPIAAVPVISAVVVTLAVLMFGSWTFARLERAVLKEI